MKLADDALIAIIEILRKGLMDGMDVSQLLRELDLTPNSVGKLGVSAADDLQGTWKVSQNETD